MHEEAPGFIAIVWSECLNSVLCYFGHGRLGNTVCSHPNERTERRKMKLWKRSWQSWHDCSRSPIWSLQRYVIMNLSPLKGDALKLPLAFFEQAFLGVVADMNNMWLCCGGVCSKSGGLYKEMNKLKKEGLVLSWPIHAGYGHTLLKPVRRDTQSTRLVLHAGTTHKEVL